MASQFRVRVRMYRHGLGDCFLLTFPRRQGIPFQMLIDFGALARNKDQMQELATRINADSGGRLDVVVATHEHRDHLSGFNQARSIIEDVVIGSVWLPWTENLGVDEIRAIKEAKRKTAKVVRAALAKSEGAAELDGVASLLSFSDDDGDDAVPAATIADALEYLKLRGEQAGDLRYLEPGEGPIEMEGVDGWRVWVLGPPRDPALLKGSEVTERMKREGVVYHLTAMGTAGLDAVAAAVSPETAGGNQDRFQPFAREHRIARDTEFFPALQSFVEKTYDAPEESWRRIDTDWLGTYGQLALDLDNDTNNTSLVLAFEHVRSGNVLLFPGDAQVGNWLSWENVEFEVPGRARRVKGHDLLRRTVFYKVGHHCSHNATLRKGGLELMRRDNLVAFVPLDIETAEKMRWKMPAEALLTALKDRTEGRVVISDIKEPVPPEAMGAGVTEADHHIDWHLR